MADKPSVPRGTRDFSPTEMVRRNYIFDTIKGVFRKYGYQQIETPSMENLSTLMGKYGDEGDKLIFKVLDSGPYFEKTTISKKITQLITRLFKLRRDQDDKISKINIENQSVMAKMVEDAKKALIDAEDSLLAFLESDFTSKKLSAEISEKALRYDLTVPFARYVVMHQNEITFPFKRFQVQPVWRADRPQKALPRVLPMRC